MAVTIPEHESHGSRPEPRSAMEVVTELCRLWAQSRYDEIRSTHHPDARLITVAGGPDPLGPDETHAALMAALRKASYRPPETVEAVAIDETAALGAQTSVTPSSTAMPLPGGSGSFTVRDGLLFRSMPLHSEAEARARYNRHGRTLGL